MPVTRDLKLAISRPDVLRHLGTVGGAAAGAKTVVITDGMLADSAILDLMRPAMAYELIEIDYLDAPALGLRGEELSDRFPGAQALAVSVASIGSALEERVASYFSSREQLKALVLDAIGSAAIDGLRIVAREAIMNDPAAHNLQAGDDFSPGCEGWPVEAQAILLGLVRASEIGVTLTEGLMLHPCKSISMVMAIGSRLTSRTGRDRCAGCPSALKCSHHLAIKAQLPRKNLMTDPHALSQSKGPYERTTFLQASSHHARVQS
jgi:hypothetical protein